MSSPSGPRSLAQRGLRFVGVEAGLTLAFEPAETDVMRRPPRDPRAPIFSGCFLRRTGLVSLVLMAGTLGIFLWDEESFHHHGAGERESG